MDLVTIFVDGMNIVTFTAKSAEEAKHYASLASTILVGKNIAALPVRLVKTPTATSSIGNEHKRPESSRDLMIRQRIHTNITNILKGEPIWY